MIWRLKNSYLNAEHNLYWFLSVYNTWSLKFSKTFYSCWTRTVHYFSAYDQSVLRTFLGYMQHIRFVNKYVEIICVWESPSVIFVQQSSHTAHFIDVSSPSSVIITSRIFLTWRRVFRAESYSVPHVLSPVLPSLRSWWKNYPCEGWGWRRVVRMTDRQTWEKKMKRRKGKECCIERNEGMTFKYRKEFENCESSKKVTFRTRLTDRQKE